jgi:hypothetical protein
VRTARLSDILNGRKPMAPGEIAAKVRAALRDYLAERQAAAQGKAAEAPVVAEASSPPAETSPSPAASPGPVVGLKWAECTKPSRVCGYEGFAKKWQCQPAPRNSRDMCA